jgi:anti-sigma28 factor (negative regulator of flagellin synthesis)
MRIHDLNYNGAEAAGLGKSKATESVGKSGAPGTGAGRVLPGGDQIEISSLADRISTMLSADENARGQRLGRLEALVAAGRYQPDFQAVSHQIVDEALNGGGLDGTK